MLLVSTTRVYAATLQIFERMLSRFITIENGEIINQTEAKPVAERAKGESSRLKQVRDRK